MTFGVTKTGSMYHAIAYGALRCDNRKRPHKVIEMEEPPHMFCNLCDRIVGKPVKQIWFYHI